jgi:hypothetical protein
LGGGLGSSGKILLNKRISRLLIEQVVLLLNNILLNQNVFVDLESSVKPRSLDSLHLTQSSLPTHEQIQKGLEQLLTTFLITSSIFSKVEANCTAYIEEAGKEAYLGLEMDHAFVIVVIWRSI